MRVGMVFKTFVRNISRYKNNSAQYHKCTYRALSDSIIPAIF